MSREYKKRKRADSEAETRQRITEATMHLHERVGPAKTTVSAIAEEARVQRATVYRHFPGDADLIQACGGLWTSLNPPPDPSGLPAITDPDERLRTALSDLYGWYERTAEMQVKIARDRKEVPALDASLRQSDAFLEAITEILMKGRPERRAAKRRARAAIAHALEFETWRSLVRRQGLTTAEAVELMAKLAA
jgi:AcrR family transcriptional regulator